MSDEDEELLMELLDDEDWLAQQIVLLFTFIEEHDLTVAQFQDWVIEYRKRKLH